MRLPRTPKELEAAGRKFWRAMHKEMEFKEIHDLERLKMACRCLDEIADDEEVIKNEGRFVLDRFNQKREHPAIKNILSNKVLFCRIVRELNIDIQPPESRLPRLY